MDAAALVLQAVLILVFLLINALFLFVLYLNGQRPFLILLSWKTVL